MPRDGDSPEPGPSMTCTVIKRECYYASCEYHMQECAQVWKRGFKFSPLVMFNFYAQIMPRRHCFV